MEASTATTLQKKKINKGKLKRTIKNVLCRPDPVFWPVVTEEQRLAVEATLNKFKVAIPEFQKPLWKDLKDLPKDHRPKPPKIDKVEGLLFGITECSNTIENGLCAGIIIEAAVNPRSIVQPLLELCINRNIPVICCEGLRKTTKVNFGIPTSCLGIKKEFLTEISDTISEFGQTKLPRKKQTVSKNFDIEMIETNTKTNSKDLQDQFEYLYRANKNTRVFIPPSEIKVKEEIKIFKGQDFIEFSDKMEQQDKKAFKKMMVKKISNNPNRVKVK